MNPSVSILAQQYQLNHALVSAAVKDLPEKHIAERINDIGNSMKWLTGHLATSRYVLMKLLGIDEGCPLGDLFARGAEVKPDNECPSLDEILKVWNDVTGKLDARLEKITDEALATELLADEKERAEHIMLVDLGRNDLGRVCEYGTVGLKESFVIERYSHVMHIASHIQGKLQPGRDAFDLLRATFPAGTVSGAPKVRAMEIIEELEGTRRGPYAGAILYMGYNGSLDSCITIRTIWMKGNAVYIQSGGGVVADSDPTLEYQETLHKAKALSVAVTVAEQSR